MNNCPYCNIQLDVTPSASYCWNCGVHFTEADNSADLGVNQVQGYNSNRGYGVKRSSVWTRGKSSPKMPGGEIDTNESLRRRRLRSSIFEQGTGDPEYAGELLITYNGKDGIDVNAPGLHYTNVDPFRFLEHLRSSGLRTPLDHFYVVHKLSDWFKHRARPGDELAVNLTSGHSIVRNYKTGEFYTLGILGTMNG